MQVLDKRRIADLLKEVDPLEQLDDDAEEVIICIFFAVQTHVNDLVIMFVHLCLCHSFPNASKEIVQLHLCNQFWL